MEPFPPSRSPVVSSQHKIALQLCFRGRVGQWSVAAGESLRPTTATNEMLILVEAERP